MSTLTGAWLFITNSLWKTEPKNPRWGSVWILYHWIQLSTFRIRLTNVAKHSPICAREQRYASLYVLSESQFPVEEACLHPRVSTCSLSVHKEFRWTSHLIPWLLVIRAGSHVWWLPGCLVFGWHYSRLLVSVSIKCLSELIAPFGFTVIRYHRLELTLGRHRVTSQLSDLL